MPDNKFSFLPWMRQGIAAQIAQPESFGHLSGDFQARAVVPLRLAIDAVPKGGSAYVHTGEANDIVQQIELFGPGEVTGIQQDAIVSTDPEAGVSDYEPNYLPYVEFFAEDFPWRYSPARAVDGKLRPWLTLLVLEESEFTKKMPPGALLPVITHGQTNIPFPDASQSWAWAHVHVNRTLDQPDTTHAAQLENIVVNENPNLASSRIICPRRLKPNTAYQAFLIPAFEQGRLAGLGAPDERILQEDVRQSAWAEQQADEYANHWPYYFEWSFRTGDLVDFEFLVRMIEPRVLDDDMGRRPMDCSDAGYLIQYTAGTGDRQGILDLEGALQSPVADHGYEKLVGETSAEKKKFLHTLQQFLNLSTDLQETTPQNNFYIDQVNDLFPGDVDAIDDPIVLPPLYGQWHAQRERIDYEVDAPTQSQKKYWFNQANLDPRNRAAAGIGTQIVQKNQESYMDRAWGQVGEVLEAIRQLRLASLSAEVSEKLYAKHLDTLEPLAFANVTAPVHAKVKIDDHQTVEAFTIFGTKSKTFVKRGLSKVTRPGGPAVKRAGVHIRANELAARAYDNLFTLMQSPAATEHAGHLFSLGAFSNSLMTVAHNNGSLDTLPLSSTLLTGIDLDHVSTVLGLSSSGSSSPGLRSLSSRAAVNSPGLLATLGEYVQTNNWTPPQANSSMGGQNALAIVKDAVSTKMKPRKVIARRAWKNIQILREPSTVLSTGPQVAARGLPVAISNTPEEIIEVLAYPKFTEPMYLAMQEHAEAYFLPGIERIPENTFSILETNQRFIEAYLLGLNHEMARELLWREYPTDQKGSYFRKFWDDIDGGPASHPFDIEEITSWGQDELGHNHPADAAAANRLVFVVRGELLKRFPNTVIYLHKAMFIDGDPTKGRTLCNSDLSCGDKKYILPAFKAKAKPDITFLGFNISIDAANGDKVTDPGYFIVVKERPGEPRFGFDLPPVDPDDLVDPATSDQPGEAAFSWNDGNWQHIGLDAGGYIRLEQGDYQNLDAKITETETDRLQWGKNAAHMAGIMYQLPFMVAIHADAMISDEIL